MFAFLHIDVTANVESAAAAATAAAVSSTDAKYIIVIVWQCGIN